MKATNHFVSVGEADMQTVITQGAATEGSSGALRGGRRGLGSVWECTWETFQKGQP